MDAACVARERRERLSAEERRRFPPLWPDFVEQLPKSDCVAPLQQKMEEWTRNGCHLA